MQPTAEQRERIQDAYDRGRYLDAWDLARDLAPPWQWHDTAAAVLGSRLCGVLGAPTRARAIARAAHRRDPADPTAAFYRGLQRLGRASLPNLEEHVRRHRPPPGAPPRIASDWLCLESMIAGILRDFVRADALLARAEEAEPERPWVHVEKAMNFLRQDRPRQALAAAERSLQLRADYRPGVQAAATCHVVLGDDEAALELLARADERLQCGPIALQRGALLAELDRHDEAAAALVRARELMPLLEPGFEAHLAARESDIAARRGDTALAAQLAEKAGRGGFHALVARNARQAPPDAVRLTLPVPWVRQDHMTCAPATLTAIAHYWGEPADHVEVAGEICVDGTPSEAERAWAEEHGFAVREFTVTWDAGRALLRRGVPFTLATVAPESAHLQAVVGFDEHRRVFICRDPATRGLVEMLADEMLKRHGFTGPRGMAMVPVREAARLEGLELPDAAVRDRWHVVRRSLGRHEREPAAAALAAMEAMAPGHELVTHARLALAAYDCNEPERARCLRVLAAAHPDETTPLLWEISSLRQLGLRSQRLEILERRVASWQSDPILWVELATELAEDGREAARAESLCRMALVRIPLSVRAFELLATALWVQGRFADALRHYRTAAILQPLDETLARTWFRVARVLGRTDEALAELRERFAQHGARSAAPARALVRALLELDRSGEVRDVLARARALRPDDGELALAAAQAHLSLGDAAAAEAELARAAAGAPEHARLRLRAAIAEHRGDLAGALSVLREQLERAPANADLHDGVARLLGATEGPDAALAHLRDACRRFPHHRQLLRLRLHRLGRWGRDEREAALRQALELHPEDAWMRRELALCLSDLARHDEALAEAQQALASDPHDPASHRVLSTVLARVGRVDEARAALRASLRLDVDDPWAVSRMLDLAPDRDAARADVESLRDALMEGAVDGAAIEALCAGAASCLAPEELLELARAFHARRPGLWRAAAQLAAWLRRRDDLAGAAEILTAATAAFPHVAALHVQLALLRRQQGDEDGERAALESALTLEPGLAQASVLLALHHRRAARFGDAEAVLRAALARDPDDATCLHALADLLFWVGRGGETLPVLQRAVEADPASSDAWELLERAAAEAAQPDAALEAARRLVRRQPGNVLAWLAVARTATAPSQHDERIAALDRAIALAPLDIEAHDMKARVLAEAHDYDAALRACRPETWGDDPPAELLGRAAWIEWERGRRAAARQLLGETLKRHPDYVWGWWRLYEWSEEQREPEGRRESLRALARLLPSSANVMALLGRLHADEGQHDKARAAYERAFALAPEDGETVDALFRACLRAGDHAAAARVLARAAPHFMPGWEQALKLDLLLAQDAGEDALVAEATAAATAAGALPGALRRFIAVGRTSLRHAAALHAAFETAALSARGGEHAAQALVTEAAEARRWRHATKLIARLPAGSEAWLNAADALLDAAGSSPNLVVDLFLLRHGRRLRADVRTWGKAGYYLLEKGAYRRATWWLRDWRSRKAEPWMLQNLALSLRVLGRRSKAAEVSRAAIEASGDRDCDSHRVMLAVDALAAGRIDEAALHVSRVRRTGLGDYLDYCLGCLDAALSAHAASAAASSPQERTRLFREHRAQLVRLGPAGWAPVHVLRKAARSAARRVLARSLGSPLQRLLAAVFP